MKRHADGRFRNPSAAGIISPIVMRARWLEAEAIHLKRMGLSFESIAEQISRVGQGRATPITAIPSGVSFPSDYRISRQAVHRAVRRALSREPALEVDEFRKLDHARSEDLYLNLQPAIRKGNPRAIEVGLKVLDHGAKIHGYAAPQRHELTGRDGKPLTLVQLLEAIGPIKEEEAEKK